MFFYRTSFWALWPRISDLILKHQIESKFDFPFSGRWEKSHGVWINIWMHSVLVWGKDTSEGNLMRLRYKENTGWWPLVKWLMFYFHRSLESLYICIDPPKTEPVSAHFPQGYFSITKCLSYFWCLNWYDCFFLILKCFIIKLEKKVSKSLFSMLLITSPLHISGRRTKRTTPG